MCTLPLDIYLEPIDVFNLEVTKLAQSLEIRLDLFKDVVSIIIFFEPKSSFKKSSKFSVDLCLATFESLFHLTKN